MESFANDLFELFRNIGVRLISLLTLLVCLLIVLSRWKRHPKVSLIAAVGLVLLILHSLFFAVADVWLPHWFIDAGFVSTEVYYAVFGLLISVTLAIAFAVLLVAIFIDRKPARQKCRPPGFAPDTGIWKVDGEFRETTPMKFSYFYYLFGRRWPVLLLMLAGIVVAILRRKHHPKASLLTVSALVLFIVQSLAFGSMFYLLPRLHDSGFSYGTINNLFLLIEVCRDIVYAGTIGLLVCAVLSQRNPQADVPLPR